MARAKKKDILSEFDRLDFDIGDEELQRLTGVANTFRLLADAQSRMIQIKKQEIELENKAGNLCLKKDAIDSFDAMIAIFAGRVRRLPETIQSKVKDLSPEQYKAIVECVYDMLSTWKDVRLTLKVASTLDIAKARTVAKNATLAKKV